MDIVSLGSGSKGNSLFVGINGVNILIDVGLSMKKINERLLINVGIDLEDIDMIMITHAHSDHVASLHTIVKKYPQVKIVLPKLVYESYIKKKKKYISQDMRIELSEQSQTVKGKKVNFTSFKINHDEPCYAYKIVDKKTNESFLFIADNGGIKSNYMLDLFKGCTYYAIESNHDLTMQIFSKRDTLLKRRVLGYYGHNHNVEAVETLYKVLTSETKGVIFHHLSEECNTEELARETHIEWSRIWGKMTLYNQLKVSYARQEESVTLVEEGGTRFE